MIPLYRIHNIHISSFSMQENDPGIRTDGVLVDINTGINWDKDQKLIILIISIKFRNKETDENLMTAITENQFLIKNYDEVIAHKGSEVQTSESLLQALFSISVGTLRGVIVAKTENTYLSKIFVPPINPNLIVEQMKKVSQEEPVDKTA